MLPYANPFLFNDGERKMKILQYWENNKIQPGIGN